ncbi:hypothetical protein MKX01_011387 [Papaver californicum]|nr:hypothetical protein MKX01_011387 [Papaver californicum]
MCIYNASWKTHFGFCCDIDEADSRELSVCQKFYPLGLTGILNLRRRITV